MTHQKNKYIYKKKHLHWHACTSAITGVNYLIQVVEMRI